MRKIVAIGGGEIGRPGYPIETLEIDKEIVRLTKKQNPKLLLIPTASGDSPLYYDVVDGYFGKRLGCDVEVLYLIKEKPRFDEIEEKIMSSDIIYVGGGNTLKMMKVWRNLKLDKILLQALNKGIVLSGVSAGSICWFKHGSSDSRRFSNQDAGLIKVRGLNFVNALHCPHYDVEEDRRPNLAELMKKTPGVAIAIDNCCAVEIVGDTYRVISSKENANAYKVYWKNGEFYEEVIKKSEDFVDIKHLLTK